MITPPVIIKWLIYLPQEVFLFLLSSGEGGGGRGAGDGARGGCLNFHRLLNHRAIFLLQFLPSVFPH